MIYRVVGENTNNRVGLVPSGFPPKLREVNSASRFTRLLVKTPTIEDRDGSFNCQAALAPGLRMIIGFVLAAKRVGSLWLPAKTQRGQ